MMRMNTNVPLFRKETNPTNADHDCRAFSHNTVPQLGVSPHGALTK
jgi:hypothetical protein